MTALASPLAAQHWSGSIYAALVEQSTDGSEASFRSQVNQDDGFLLEELELRFDGGEGSDREFTLRAWGFGSAEPTQGARLDWRPAKAWRLGVDYRRTESFFQLAETELGLRTDDWRITRWRTDLAWEGWKPALVTLSLGYVDRSGTITQPFRELNTTYLLGTDLDETQKKAALRLETRSLPVKLIFEQGLARYERNNRRFPGAERNLEGDDPDLLVAAASDRREERDIPTSRLTATYGNERWEVAGALLWSPTELDAVGEDSTTFGLANDTVGRVQFADDLLGSASLDALVGQLEVGVRLAPRWTLRLRGDYRDRAQDATLLGQRILRLSNAQGDAVEIPVALDERTFFDVTDAATRLEIEHRRGNWSVWGGFVDTRREVGWQNGGDDPAFGVDRDSEGGLLGLAWRLGRRLKASFEYEHGSFERFVFRTDPETVDRYTLKIRTDLAKGFKLSVRGRVEEADNPDSQSSLDRSSSALGVGLSWLSEDGERDFGFDLDQVDLETETGLIFPDGSPGLSRYDLSLLTLGAHGRVRWGKVSLAGNAHYVEDSGATWPLETWNARARLAVEAAPRAEVAVFGEYWRYDEDLAAGDDFDVTRYGVAFGWRFE